MVFTLGTGVEGEVSMQPEGEFDLDKMDQQVQNFKFNNFYNQMDSS